MRARRARSGAAAAALVANLIVLINLLNGKNTREENCLHFRQSILAFVRKSLNEKYSNRLENNAP